MMLACSFDDFCIGSLNNASNVCHEGHVGILCDDCDIEGRIWKQSYYMAEQGKNCAKCAD